MIGNLNLIDFFHLETYKCRAGLPSTNSNNLLCVKNCSLSDPVHGSSKVVFGQTKYLESEPGYQWTNSLGQSINSVKCDFYDFGGVYESIKLDYKWKCLDGYYKLGDNSCKGKSSLKEKHNIALTYWFSISKLVTVIERDQFYLPAMEMVYAKNVATM